MAGSLDTGLWIESELPLSVLETDRWGFEIDAPPVSVLETDVWLASAEFSTLEDRSFYQIVSGILAGRRYRFRITINGTEGKVKFINGEPSDTPFYTWNAGDDPNVVADFLSSGSTKITVLADTHFVGSIPAADTASLKRVTDIIVGNESGADIEEIEPGDTCRFVGFSSELGEIFQENMLITSVRYSLDSVEIEVEVKKSGLVEFQEQQSRDIHDVGTGGLEVPEEYTT